MAWVEQLELVDFRCHKNITLEFQQSGPVVLEGKNGCGKTSVLESIYFALRGRSFRTQSAAELIRYGRSEARVLLRLTNDQQHFLGISVEKRKKSQHLDGAPINRFSEIASRFPVAYLGYKAYELLVGSPAMRRMFLDWGVFHVKPQYLNSWRLWRRAHRHRNVYLRGGRFTEELGVWSVEVAKYGEEVARAREEYIQLLNSELSKLVAWQQLFCGARLVYQRGWNDGQTLREAIRRNESREKKSQRSVVGPQLDDWAFDLVDGKSANLSKGQQKLACFWLWHAQCRILEGLGRAPLLLVDDLAADLDFGAQQEAIGALTDVAEQVWVTSLGGGMGIGGDGHKKFHVEQQALMRT